MQEARPVFSTGNDRTWSGGCVIIQTRKLDRAYAREIIQNLCKLNAMKNVSMAEAPPKLFKLL